jgi:hypothetical protein
MRVKVLLCTSIAVVAMAFASVATADNFGTNATQAAQMKTLIYQAFGSGWKGQTMIRCAARESGFNPRAANWHDSHGGSFGLFQINGIHDPASGSYATRAWISRMMVPAENIRMAVRLARGGLGPWGGGC